MKKEQNEKTILETKVTNLQNDIDSLEATVGELQEKEDMAAKAKTEAEESLKGAKEEKLRLLMEHNVVKEELEKQNRRVKELEKNKLTQAQLDQIRHIVDDRKRYKARVEELEKKNRSLSVEAREVAKLPRNVTEPREKDEVVGEETMNLEKELLSMKDKLQNMKKDIRVSHRDTLPSMNDVPTTVPKKSVKRNGGKEEDSKRRRVDEEDGHCQTQ